MPGGHNSAQYETEAKIAAFEHNPDGAIATLKSAIQLGLRAPQAFDVLIFEDL